MTIWGTSVNGYWKLGVDFVTVEETSTYIDIRAVVKIWTKYATWEGSNSLTISGDWSYSGSTYAFDVKTNIAWSTNNIAIIWQGTKRFTRSYSGDTASISVRLTGVNYPNTSYVETLNASQVVGKLKYGMPTAPTNLVATRIADNQISFTWTNNNPTSTTSPYQAVEITAVDENDSSKTWFRVAYLEVQSSYTWTGARPDRKYRFAVRAINIDAYSEVAYSNYVYTTPSAPANLTSNFPSITGSTDPKTQSLDFVWEYPSGNYQSVTGYLLSWTGPTNGSATSTSMFATANGLIAGGKYTFTVQAKNPGDGNDIVYGPSSLPYTYTLYDVPRTAPVLTAGSPNITGSNEPKTSSINLSWNSVPSAESYVIKSGSTILGSTTQTSIIINNLSPGSTYSLVVYPVNNIGTGTPSSAIKITTAGLPGPPSINKFVPILNGLEIELGPGSSNGSNILKYQYRITTNTDVEFRPWTDVTSMSFTVPGVSSGTVYRLYVRSVNSVGTGTQTAMLTSDASGGRIAVWDGSKLVYRYIRTNEGIAPVRIYDGTSWVLTNK